MKGKRFNNNINSSNRTVHNSHSHSHSHSHFSCQKKILLKKRQASKSKIQ